MSTSGAHRARTRRGDRASWGVTSTPHGGRHLLPAERRLTPVVKQLGLATVVTSVSVGTVTFSGHATASAAAPREVAALRATVDLASDGRTTALSRDTAKRIGTATGPATIGNYHAPAATAPKRLLQPARTVPAQAAPKHRLDVALSADDATALAVRQLPECPAPTSTTGFRNGQIPRADLCTIPGTTQRLRSDAAAAFVALNAAYKAHFGTDIGITDSYRDLETQKKLFKRKPLLAAIPGTSEHGWGIAVDLSGGIEDLGTDEHQWMLEHAPAFGWDNPDWARPGGEKLEPWHWEYTAPGTQPPS